MLIILGWLIIFFFTKNDEGLKWVVQIDSETSWLLACGKSQAASLPPLISTEFWANLMS